MKKNIFMALVILVLVGCSDKEPELKPTNEKVDIRTSNADDTVPADFVPEHLRHSKIEVVKHY